MNANKELSKKSKSELKAWYKFAVKILNKRCSSKDQNLVKEIKDAGKLIDAAKIQQIKDYIKLQTIKRNLDLNSGGELADTSIKELVIDANKNVIAVMEGSTDEDNLHTFNSDLDDVAKYMDHEYFEMGDIYNTINYEYVRSLLDSADLFNIFNYDCGSNQKIEKYDFYCEKTSQKLYSKIAKEILSVINK